MRNAQVVELADTGDLKSPGQMRLCGFESRPGHFFRCYFPLVLLLPFNSTQPRVSFARFLSDAGLTSERHF